MHLLIGPVFVAVLAWLTQVPLWAEDRKAPPSLIMDLLYYNRELPHVSKPDYLSPCDLVLSPDAKWLYVAEHTGKRIDVVDLATGKVSASIPLPREPTGLALSGDGRILYVTCSSDQVPQGLIGVVDPVAMSLLRTYAAGHSPRAPALSPDGRTLYYCNQFENSVAVMDPASGNITARIKVIREPFDLALTPDGTRLVVANYLPYGRSDLPVFDAKLSLAGSVSIVNTATRVVEASLMLANGSHTLSGVSISADGKHAYIAHMLARYPIPTTKIEGGWIQTNGFSVVDIPNKKVVNVVLVDDPDRGAANPWSILVHGGRLLLTAGGTHELIILQESKLVAGLVGQGDLSYSLTFAQAFKQRLSLDVRGPRSVAAAGQRAYVAGYFSDTIEVVDFSTGKGVRAGKIGLRPRSVMSQARLGELRFNDASICHQGWLSCASCHPLVRTDGLNWDNLNDGLGNPKNDRSLVMAHYTPPAMAHGIRVDAETAVRAGIQHILFSEPREEDALAIDAYLKGLRPVPSPFLEKEQLSEAAKRGKAHFYGKFKCQDCHPAPLYTDMKFHDVGTQTAHDENGNFDTPTLLETWRNSPYLHDGRYENTLQLFKDGKHGIFAPATDQELRDLVEFVNSL